jgi:RNA polymerase sigma-70 factor (ECF subfamily)
MTGKSAQAAGAAAAAGRPAPTKEGGAASRGHRPGFLDWMSQLVHAQRGRLYRLARREGLRDQDAFDCVQDAFHTFLLLPQARRLVGYRTMIR